MAKNQKGTWFINLLFSAWSTDAADDQQLDRCSNICGRNPWKPVCTYTSACLLL